MTRINLIPPSELTRPHLQGEYKEIARVFTLTRNAQNRGKNKWNYGIPTAYTMGTGHVKFFSDKLLFVLNRYHLICKEMIDRGYNINPIPYKSLIEGIDKHWLNDYTPTQEAIEINKQRIAERLKEMEI